MAARMHLKKSQDRGTRKVTPPSPTFMTNEQFATYLADLRSSRVARPGGARPLQDSRHPQPPRVSIGHADSSRTLPAQSSLKHDRAVSGGSNITAGSVSSRYSTMGGRGRDYYPNHPVVPLKPSEVVPSTTYIERGQRWMEKEEAVSLREAMHAMDLKTETTKSMDDSEARLYQAALDEASELVWQHKHGEPPPPADAPYRYRPHLRKNSYAHARTASVGRYGDEICTTGLARDTPRSVSGSSGSSEDRGSQKGRASLDSFAEGQVPAAREADAYESVPLGSRPSKPYRGIGAGPLPSTHRRRRSSMKRNISGEVERPFSGDQIWEEPEISTPERDSGISDFAGGSTVPHSKMLSGYVHSPVSQSRTGYCAPLRVRSIVDIHRNPPSQTRNPGYTTNGQRDHSVREIPNKAGVEIRGDDIRQATGMKLSQRSAKLPTPTGVSNNPGRPIVSFKSDWRPVEAAAPEADGGTGRSTITLIPTIVVPDDKRPCGVVVPSITVSGVSATQKSHASVPSINVDPPQAVPLIVTQSGGGDSQQSTTQTPPRPLPKPGVATSRRPLPSRTSGKPVMGIGSRATASCHECGFPIEGRFVALAGTTERFHPQCFSCFSCGTSLEALEISPEPDAARTERLERIRRRTGGEALEEESGKTAAEDGDERLRFYCHLDWHELFAPRCKHCKTPIIGEHVVALGEHWHYGHFFCAECGDPFGEDMTHIEKDGYAWCINCQTRRTERRAPKCKKCKTAVIGQYVQALGGEWHDECFRCATCNGSFEDGQIFPRGDGGDLIVLCTKCRATELKQ